MEKQFRYDFQTAVVETDKGLVHGYEYDGMSIFKGIPYARSKRFHDPEPVEPWDGLREATGYGYVCPLLDEEGLDSSLGAPHRIGVQNENCQNLNVWTPACDDKKRPVMVWLHGGAFSGGSSIEQVAYEGENLCKHGQIVFVSINHRLNVLGYCDLSEFGEEYKNSGNAGTSDMVAALQWIHRNIAAFGGDPGNVTIFGQSGGGMKVTALLQTPAADGLYHKGIIMSGVQGGALFDCVGSGRQMGELMMESLGVKTAKELEEAPYQDLVRAFKDMRYQLRPQKINSGETPCRNAFYLGDPLEVPFRKETIDIPILVGSTFSEFSGFGVMGYDRKKITDQEAQKAIEEKFGKALADEAIPLFRQAYPERNLIDLLGMDYMFRDYTFSYLERRCGYNSCTWDYIFNLDGPMYGGQLPPHCADIPFVFHNTELVPSTQEAGVTERVEKEIFDTVMAFVKTGNPNNPSIPQWKHDSPEEFNTMVFDRKTGVRTNFDCKLVKALSREFLDGMVDGILKGMARKPE